MDYSEPADFFKKLSEKIKDGGHVEVFNVGNDEFEFYVGENFFGRVDVYLNSVDYLLPESF